MKIFVYKYFFLQRLTKEDVVIKATESNGRHVSTFEVRGGDKDEEGR